MKKINRDKIKTWFVTGASSGVGYEMCKQLLGRGYNVVAVSRRVPKFEHPNALCISVDVTRPESIKTALGLAIERFNKVDVLVNNAGISANITLEEENIEHMKEVMETNFFGTFNTSKIFVEYFRKNKNGTILNNTSQSGIGARPYGSAYVSSKHALEGLTKVCRHEIKSFCRVMAFELGWFKSTDIVKNAKSNTTEIEEYKKLNPLSLKVKNNYTNDLNIAISHIIDQVEANKLPRRLMLGKDALGVIGYELKNLFFDYINSYKRASNCSVNNAHSKEEPCDYLLVNFWDSWNNYGALLTAFAMQQLIRSFGYTTKYLDTGERTKRTSYKKSFGEEFSKNFLTKTTIMNYRQAQKFSKQIKGVILGSDQVLRLRFINHSFKKYLLNFADENCKKIALSASFGISEKEFIEENKKKEIQRVKKALKSFDYLSCREISSKDIYKNIFGLSSDMIMDPVFLIEKDEYNIILEKATLDCSNKIVSYVLDTNEEYDNLYSNLSQKLNSEIMPLYMKDARPSVSNWLNAIKTCKFLVTDSFHGVCFALIFNKPFVCIKNIRRGSARFDSLCEIFDIEQCFVSNAKEAQNYNFVDLDFKGINEKIQLEKERCLEIINSVLNKNYSNNPNKTSTNNSDSSGYFKNLLDYLKNKMKACCQTKKKKKNKYRDLARKAKHNMIWN